MASSSFGRGPVVSILPVALLLAVDGAPARSELLHATLGATREVANVGDFDGDGRPELATVGPNEVRLIRSADPDGAGLTFPQERLELISVSESGDLNGDGWPDVLIGGRHRTGDVPNQGVAEIYFGGKGPGQGDTTADLEIRPPFETTAKGFGWSVRIVGDVTGDGFDDFVVSGGVESEADPDAAATFLYAGGPSVSNVPYWSIGRTLGRHTPGRADLNGDGRPDLVLGSKARLSETQRVSIWYGPLGATEADPDVVLEAAPYPAYSSFADYLDADGDFNGDGVDDLAIGVSANDGEYSFPRSAVEVYFGPIEAGAGPDWVAFDPRSRTQARPRVMYLPDQDNDGDDELIMGNPDFEYDCTLSSGEVYLFRGGESPSVYPEDTIHGRWGVGVGYCLGHMDMDGDGVDELAVGDGFPGDFFAGTAPTLRIYRVPDRKQVYAPAMNGAGSRLVFHLIEPHRTLAATLHVRSAAGSGFDAVEMARSDPDSPWEIMLPAALSRRGGEYFVELTIRNCNDSPNSDEVDWDTFPLRHPYPDSNWAAPETVPEVFYELDPDLHAVPTPAGWGSLTVSPNPLRSGAPVRVDWSEATGTVLSARVFDPAGRRVRSLIVARNGPATATWDGRDTSGRLVASGVYFVRVRTADASATRRVVVLR